ncbi:MAG: hypothetical protein K0R92_83 [Lachnospiraceae bacterium]|jgi:uncharacterized membrane protein|nr:hypothetical protein [Lachnospiraceae bacterium]
MLYAADFRRIAREALRGRWALAVGTGFVAALLGGISKGGSSNGSSSNGGDSFNSFLVNPFGTLITVIISFILLWALIAFFIGGAIELGYCRFNLNLINDTNPKFNDLFSRFNIFLKALGLRLVIAIFTLLWTLLFIIPGIIATFSYSMAFYIMEEDPSIGILDAISQSKELMRGNKYRLFCLSFSFIGWIMFSVITFGIGMLWLIPYMNASFAAFYLEISGKNQFSYTE